MTLTDVLPPRRYAPSCRDYLRDKGDAPHEELGHYSWWKCDCTCHLGVRFEDGVLKIGAR